MLYGWRRSIPPLDFISTSEGSAAGYKFFIAHFERPGVVVLDSVFRVITTSGAENNHTPENQR